MPSLNFIKLSGRTLLIKVVQVIGILLILAGLSLIGMYIVQVWQVLEASNQSVIFWYLPIVFLGLVAIIMGIMSMAWVKRQRLKEQTKEQRNKQ